MIISNTLDSYLVNILLKFVPFFVDTLKLEPEQKKKKKKNCPQANLSLQISD
jgi:hypothetical protein